MKLTGHKTESIYRRYAIVSENDLSEGVAKLAALHDASSGVKEAQKVVSFSDKQERVKLGLREGLRRKW